MEYGQHGYTWIPLIQTVEKFECIYDLNLKWWWYWMHNIFDNICTNVQMWIHLWYQLEMVVVL